MSAEIYTINYFSIRIISETTKLKIKFKMNAEIYTNSHLRI